MVILPLQRKENQRKKNTNETPKDAPKDTSKDNPKNTQKDNPKETSKDKPEKQEEDKDNMIKKKGGTKPTHEVVVSSQETLNSQDSAINTGKTDKIKKGQSQTQKKKKNEEEDSKNESKKSK